MGARAQAVRLFETEKDLPVEPFYIVGGNVSWCSHYGRQYGGSSEN